MDSSSHADDHTRQAPQHTQEYAGSLEDLDMILGIIERHQARERQGQGQMGVTTPTPACHLCQGAGCFPADATGPAVICSACGGTGA
jgi:hypothetical protein